MVRWDLSFVFLLLLAVVSGTVRRKLVKEDHADEVDPLESPLPLTQTDPSPLPIPVGSDSIDDSPVPVASVVTSKPVPHGDAPIPAGAEAVTDGPKTVASHAQTSGPTAAGDLRPPKFNYDQPDDEASPIVKLTDSSKAVQAQEKEMQVAQNEQKELVLAVHRMMHNATVSGRATVAEMDRVNSSHPCPSTVSTLVQGPFPLHLSCPACLSSLAALTAFMQADMNFANPEMAMFEFSHACSYVESDFIQVCRYMYNVHGRHIISMLFQDRVPAHICTCINACTASHVDIFRRGFFSLDNPDKAAPEEPKPDSTQTGTKTSAPHQPSVQSLPPVVKVLPEGASDDEVKAAIADATKAEIFKK
eukprot:gnl/Spiro4/13923_TR7447_c0_g1_i1.p1 gnl/Spiro4/13923_TR7447_c0_g1~~gnl/Spiro4/13923_TR7447_c0_g1_i1.p1  ORF type:complete len:371 (+),score=64.83 gnl/Spiro4/13923_TR7447_c0_g1_i1:32-1114(+)